MPYLDIIFFVSLILAGYYFGSRTEKKHYQSIIEREKNNQHLFVLNTHKRENSSEYDACLVMGSVVISIDYFKRILAGLRNIFGGNVSAYESLLDRGRREAMLRLQEEGVQLGATSIINIRYETASISQNANDNVGSIEVLAYGTALVPLRD